MKTPDLDLEPRDITKENIERALKPLLRSEFRDFYRRGVHDTCRSLGGQIDTLEANVNNDRLTDSQFRSLTESILGLMRQNIALMKEKL